MIRTSIRYFFFIILLFNCTPVDDVSPLPEDFFVKFYGDQDIESGNDVLSVGDGFVIFGSTNSGVLTETNTNNISDEDDSDFYIVLTDSQGNESSAVVIGTQYDEIPGRIKRLKDETAGYILIGTTTVVTKGEVSVDDSEQTDVIVYLLNNELGVVGSQTYGFVTTDDPNVEEDSNEQGFDVTEGTDGNFVLTGTTNNVNRDKNGFDASADTDNSDIYLVKINRNLDPDPIWERRFGFDGNDEGRGILSLPSNDGYAIMGITNVEKDGSGGGTNIIFATTDLDGLSEQFKAFGSGDATDDIASKMKDTTDGGYIIIGSSTTINGERSILMKVTASRTLTFFQTIEVSDGGSAIPHNGHDVIELSTGGFLIVGKRTGGFLDDDTSGDDIFLVKTDGFGAITEEGSFVNKFGGLGDDEANAVVELSDGKLVLAGTNDFGGTNSKMMMLMKLNRNGELLR